MNRAHFHHQYKRWPYACSCLMASLAIFVALSAGAIWFILRPLLQQLLQCRRQWNYLKHLPSPPVRHWLTGELHGVSTRTSRSGACSPVVPANWSFTQQKGNDAAMWHPMMSILCRQVQKLCVTSPLHNLLLPSPLSAPCRPCV